MSNKRSIFSQSISDSSPSSSPQLSCDVVTIQENKPCPSVQPSIYREGCYDDENREEGDKRREEEMKRERKRRGRRVKQQHV